MLTSDPTEKSNQHREQDYRRPSRPSCSSKRVTRTSAKEVSTPEEGQGSAVADGGAMAAAVASPATTPGITSLWTIAGLAMAPAVALGLARFAYALLLPAMRADLGWNYADAGAMNTANAGGYLIGALAAAAIARWAGVKRAFAASIFATAVAVGMSGALPDFGMLMALRFLSGLTGAIAFVTGGSLAAAAAAGGGPSRAPLALGVYFGGGGFGVAVSALAVPPLLTTVGWRGGWVILGALAMVASILSLRALARAPHPVRSPARSSQGAGWSARFMALILAGYGLFGAGYIAYATFIIAYLRGIEGFAPVEISLFWAILGLAAIVGAFAWGPVLAKLKGGRGATATIAVVTVGALIPLSWAGRPAAYISAVLFGGAFLAVIAAVTSFARRAAAPHAWTTAIDALTVAFGLGQCIGPLLSGGLSDGPNGVRSGLEVSVAILALAAAVAAFQPEPRSTE